MTLEEKIAAVKAKKEKLNAKLDARLDNLEAKAKNDKRKLDTRRKIIVGGAILAHIEKHPDFAKSVTAILASSVGRPNDLKAVADLLPPSPAAKAPPGETGGARANS